MCTDAWVEFNLDNVLDFIGKELSESLTNASSLRCNFTVKVGLDFLSYILYLE